VVSSHGDEQEAIAPPGRPLLYGAGAVALASFATAAALGASALVYSHEQDGNPAAPPLYTPDLQARASLGAGLATGAYLCIGLGALAAVIDGILWLEAHRARRK
jgi:hypothetical protein